MTEATTSAGVMPRAGKPADRIGVLIANLGSPAAPTPAALRSYLRQFLSDRRVVDLPRPLWLPILYGLILTVRPRRSARLYGKIWGPEGAPLIAMGRRQVAALEEELGRGRGGAPRLALGMRYGQPSIASALESLRDRDCDRILVLPLYPQYFSGTTGSTFDAVAAALVRWRRVPELRLVGDYHDDPAYIAALAASVREAWDRDGRPERLLLSFHGIPERYARGGDPYAGQCRRTAALLARALDLDAGSWAIGFQSRFGREKWLEPYTDATLVEWARGGVRRVDVACPGFAADCLETLEEIAITNAKLFLDSGGERFRYIPALNDRADHVRALAGIVGRNLCSWREA